MKDPRHNESLIFWWNEVPTIQVVEGRERLGKKKNCFFALSRLTENLRKSWVAFLF